MESDSVKSVEAPRVKESAGVATIEAVTWSAAPTKVTAEKEMIPEPRPVCTSTKRDKMDSVLQTHEPTENASPGVLKSQILHHMSCSFASLTLEVRCNYVTRVD